MDHIRFADVIISPIMVGAVILPPIILIIAVIIAAVLLIRHFKGRKK